MVIDLTDLASDCDEDIWVKVEGKKIKYVDKEVKYTKEKMARITVMQLLSKRRFPNILMGYCATIYVYKDQLFYLAVCEYYVHINGNWITISTLLSCIGSDCDGVVYDSLYIICDRNRSKSHIYI